MLRRRVVHCRRCAELEDELAALRDELGLSRGRWLRLVRALGLERKKAQILAILERAGGRCVSRDFLAGQVLSAAAQDRTVDTHVSRLRALLGLEIPCASGFGWSLTPDDLARLAGAVDPVEPGTDGEHARTIASSPPPCEALQAAGERGGGDSRALSGAGEAA